MCLTFTQLYCYASIFHNLSSFTSTKKIDEQSKAIRFYQETLDHVHERVICNASFEVGSEEGLDIVEEFYSDESRPEHSEQTHDLRHVQDIQQGLQKSVQALN